MTDIEFRIPAAPTPEERAKALAGRERITIETDGEDASPFWFYEPTPEQLAELLKLNSRIATDGDRLFGAWGFLMGITDPQIYQYIEGRYADPGDPFGVEEFFELIEAVIKITQARSASNRAERRALKAS